MTTATLRVIGPRTGDETITWDPTDEKAVTKARKKWESLKKKGYQFYSVTRKQVEAKGEKLDAFPTGAGEFLAVPAMAGG